MNRTPDLLRLIAADWRRLLAWLLGGWTVFAAVLTLAIVDLGCRECPDGAVALFTQRKVLLFCLIYAMAPWVFSVHDLHRGAAVLAPLPLTRRQVNAFILLRGLVLFLCCLPVWGLLVWLLPRYGIGVQPWLLLFCSLGLLAFQLFGMVTPVLVRAGVAAFFPLLIFPPHNQRWLETPLEAVSRPWPALGLILALCLFVPMILDQPLPRSQRRR